MEKKEKAKRNKTLRLTEEEKERYLAACFTESDAAAAKEFSDQIIRGDTFKVMELLPDSFVDLLIVDPPYNMDKTFNTSRFKKMKISDYERFTRKWIESLIHTLKDSASLYVCCDWKTSMTVGPLLDEYFQVRNRITWQREKGRGANANWKNTMEDVWFATCSGKYTFHGERVQLRRLVRAPYRQDGKPKGWQETEEGRFRDTACSNFWDDLSIPYWSMAENTDHPAQKPEKLFAKMILASSEEGECVLDPFAGTGGALVTAKKLNRRFLGIEKDGEYCALAARRLEIAEVDRSIQGYAGGVFWERNTGAEQSRVKKLTGQNPLQNQSLF